MIQKSMHKLLDRLKFPKKSQAGKDMSFFDRLTNGWVWSDAKNLDDVDFELRKLENRPLP